MTYAIIEETHWVREGFSPRAAHVVEHAGFELVVSGYRITKNGVKIFTGYPPFKTEEAARARIAEIS